MSFIICLASKIRGHFLPLKSEGNCSSVYSANIFCTVSVYIFPCDLHACVYPPFHANGNVLYLLFCNLPFPSKPANADFEETFGRLDLRGRWLLFSLVVIFKNNNAAASIFVHGKLYFLRPAVFSWHFCLLGSISNLQNRDYPEIQGGLVDGCSTKCLQVPFCEPNWTQSL